MDEAMEERDECARDAHRFAGDTGANLVEYSMLLALIVVVCLGALTFFGRAATGKMSCVSSAVTNATSGAAC